VGARFVTTSVSRSEKAEKREYTTASRQAEEGLKQSQAMKSNKGEIEVYDFNLLAKVFQDAAKRQES
jgi:hypothetical protein